MSDPLAAIALLSLALLVVVGVGPQLVGGAGGAGSAGGAGRARRAGRVAW